MPHLWLSGAREYSPVLAGAGLVPEDLLRTLISQGVDLYFARICEHTDRMVGMFKKVYEAAPAGGARFEEHVSSRIGCPAWVLKRIIAMFCCGRPGTLSS